MNTDILHLRYYERSGGKYRDLRHVEVRLPRMRFTRISLNGQYRSTRSEFEMHRWGNPGRSFGFEHAYVNWIHFRRHCWHLSANVLRRGITLSWGKRAI
jgi:hypothetical protein